MCFIVFSAHTKKAWFVMLDLETFIGELSIKNAVGNRFVINLLADIATLDILAFDDSVEQ